MASIKVPEPPESVPCRFNKAWQGSCNELTTNGWCDKHEPLKCCVCGQKATKDCSATMGAFVCGAALCDSCCHASHGNHHHVTMEEDRLLREEYEAEETALYASRGSPIQRVNASGIPTNLFELKKKGDVAYDEIREGYNIALTHKLMGFFPAVFANEPGLSPHEPNRIVLCFRKEQVEKIWRMLPARSSHLVTNSFYVVSELGVAYQEYQDPEMSLPIRFITDDELDQLTGDPEARPFKWAPGLLSTQTMSAEEFSKTVQVMSQGCR